MQRIYKSSLLALDLMFFGAVALIGLAWIFDPLDIPAGPLSFNVCNSPKTVALALGILAIRASFRAGVRRATGASLRGPLSSPIAKKILLSVATVYVVLGGLEAQLRRKGFRADLAPVVFEGKDAQGGITIAETLPDPILQWKYAPGTTFQGAKINSLGFRAREVQEAKEPGTKRVICMGDSCTAQGFPPYSRILHDMLQGNAPTTNRWEAFNVGVHGYSSLQGLRLLDLRVKAMKPDYVTIYFGWNDHWLLYSPDHASMAVRVTPWFGRLYDTLAKKRLFGFIVTGGGRGKVVNDYPRVLRVPPDHYQRNLTAMIDAIRGEGATPILIAAPRRNLSSELLRKGYARDVQAAELTHDYYIDLTRDVARTTGTYLVDLPVLLAGKHNDHLFAGDGIHYDDYMQEGRRNVLNRQPQPGLTRVAEEIHRALFDLVWQEQHLRK